MPRPALGPRLYLRRRAGRAAVWVILDGPREIATGCGEDRRAEAHRALADHIERRAADTARPDGPRDPDRLAIGDALAIYAAERAATRADPARIGHAIARLADWWGEMPAAAVTAARCAAYAAHRAEPRADGRGQRRTAGLATVRRELGALAAALAWCHRQGYLTRPVPVPLPDRPPPRERWLTRAEAARLLRAARAQPHLARFVLLGLYTGTRHDRLLRLRWTPHTAGGHVDLEAGLIHRRAAGEAETAKRAGVARLPRQLAAHLRRWRARDSAGGWVVSWNGERVGKIRRSWRRACREAGLGPEVTPHVLRHTAITWAMQSGARLADVAGYYGVSAATLERTYWHHHPDYQRSVVAAMERRPGR